MKIIQPDCSFTEAARVCKERMTTNLAVPCGSCPIAPVCVACFKVPPCEWENTARVNFGEVDDGS